MKILIVTKIGTGAVRSTQIIPRKGDLVDLFYKPHPRVSEGLLYPSKETLEALGCKSSGIDSTIDAIITLDQ